MIIEVDDEQIKFCSLGQSDAFCNRIFSSLDHKLQTKYIMLQCVILVLTTQLYSKVWSSTIL